MPAMHDHVRMLKHKSQNFFRNGAVANALNRIRHVYSYPTFAQAARV